MIFLCSKKNSYIFNVINSKINVNATMKIFLFQFIWNECCHLPVFNCPFELFIAAAIANCVSAVS